MLLCLSSQMPIYLYKVLLYLGAELEPWAYPLPYFKGQIF
jgi:hypothetical protein